MLTYKFVSQAKRIYSILEPVVDYLVDSKAILAGGSVSRLFTNRSIERCDWDIYFRTPEDLASFLFSLKGSWKDS